MDNEGQTRPVQIDHSSLQKISEGVEGFKFFATEKNTGARKFFKRIAEPEVLEWIKRGLSFSSPMDLAEHIISKLDKLSESKVSLPEYQLVTVEVDLHLMLSDEAGETGVAWTRNDPISKLLAAGINPWDSALWSGLEAEAIKVANAGYVCIEDAYGFVGANENATVKILDFGANLTDQSIYKNREKSHNISEAKKMLRDTKKRAALFLSHYWMEGKDVDLENQFELGKLLDNDKMKEFLGEELMSIELPTVSIEGKCTPFPVPVTSQLFQFVSDVSDTF